MTASTPGPARRCTAFRGARRLAAGPLPEVAVRVSRALKRSPDRPVLIFDDHTGSVVDVDIRGSDADIKQRLTTMPADPAGVGAGAPAPEAPRGRGRPRLGVVAREVTLLPRHWEWLGSQPGGASVALRRLVEEARKGNAGADRRRRSQEAAYRFMSAVAGDYPGYEEALRALFAGDAERFRAHLQAWPADVRAYTTQLAAGSFGREEIQS